MTDIATPPATGEWYDPDATLAAVLHVLRLQGGDIDAAAIRALIPVAGIAIDNYVDDDWVIDGPPPAPDFQYALERYTIELYRIDHPAAGAYIAPGDTYLRSMLDSLIAHRRVRWAVA